MSLTIEQEALPKSERKRIGKEKLLSDNFFIELDSSLNIFKKFESKILNEFGKENLINIFMKKRKKGYLINVTLFRHFKKIIRLQNDKSKSIVRKIINQEDYTIEKGFADSGLQTEFLENKIYKQSILYLENLMNYEAGKGNIKTKNLLRQIKQRIDFLLEKK